MKCSSLIFLKKKKTCSIFIKKFKSKSKCNFYFNILTKTFNKFQKKEKKKNWQFLRISFELNHPTAVESLHSCRQIVVHLLRIYHIETFIGTGNCQSKLCSTKIFVISLKTLKLKLLFSNILNDIGAQYWHLLISFTNYQCRMC